VSVLIFGIGRSKHCLSRTESSQRAARRWASSGSKASYRYGPERCRCESVFPARCVLHSSVRYVYVYPCRYNIPDQKVKNLTKQSTSPLSRYVVWSFLNVGTSITQGGHHVAQKSTITTFPRSDARLTERPSRSTNVGLERAGPDHHRLLWRHR
jgi:hypothetical protein